MVGKELIAEDQELPTSQRAAQWLGDCDYQPLNGIWDLPCGLQRQPKYGLGVHVRGPLYVLAIVQCSFAGSCAPGTSMSKCMCVLIPKLHLCMLDWYPD